MKCIQPPVLFLLKLLLKAAMLLVERAIDIYLCHVPVASLNKIINSSPQKPLSYDITPTLE